MAQKQMAKILGSLKIKHELTLGGLHWKQIKVTSGAAAADGTVSQRVVPDPGLRAKVVHGLGQKAGNLDQRAKRSPRPMRPPIALSKQV